MYAGIIIWSLCGGCRSTERLYFLKYCNPHLFCFFTRITALRSLSDYKALGRTVGRNALVLNFSTHMPVCFFFLFFFFVIMKSLFKLHALLLSLSLTCAGKHTLSLPPPPSTVNFFAPGADQLAMLQHKKVMFMA